MITLGQYHELEVIKPAGRGFYLDAGELGEVLLPGKYVPEGLAPGGTIRVFLSLDSEDRPIATTEEPLACVGEFAYLQVTALTDVGAFLDWGLMKDLLVPFGEQHRPMEAGKSYLVYVFLNKADGRIAASSKIDRFLKDDTPHNYKARQPVNLIIANSSDLGYKAIINHKHWGLLHKSDVHQRLSFGQSIPGFIKTILPDGKIDLVLEGGRDKQAQQAAKIEQYLREHEGYTPLHDKSSPDEIKATLGMSKNAFKNAIGSLYKQKKVLITEQGIRLLAEENHEKENYAKPVQPTVKPSVKPSVKHEKSSASAETKQPEARVVELTREPVELYKILKFEGMAGSGGEAKHVIADGQVRVNGAVETQKRKKIVSGDTIELGSEKIRVQLKV